MACGRSESQILQRFLIVIVPSVSGGVVQVRLDDMEFTQMPSTSTISTDAHLRVVVVEIDIEELELGVAEVHIINNAARLSGRVTWFPSQWPVKINLQPLGVHLGILHTVGLLERLDIRGCLHQLLLIVQDGVIQRPLLHLIEGVAGGGQRLAPERQVALVGVHVGRLGEGLLVPGLEMRGCAISPGHRQYNYHSLFYQYNK